MNCIITRLGVFAISFLVTLIAFYIYSPVIGTNAAEIVEVSVDVNIDPMVSLALDSDTVEFSFIPNGNSAFQSKPVVASVKTNSTAGYELYFGTEDNSTDMTNPNAADVISSGFSGTVTSSSMPNNTWGYSLNNTDFSKIPTSSDQDTIRNINYAPSVAEATTTINIGTKISALTAGTYSKTIRFSALAHADDYESNLDRITQLSNLYNSIQNPLPEKLPSYDYVQPWQMNEYNSQDVEEYVKTIKRAGYKGLILQYSAEFETDENNNANITSLWYQSDLVNDTSALDIYRPNILGDLMNALDRNNMEIYIGLANNNEWFSNKFNDSSWATSANNLNKDIIDEIYSKYGSHSSFKGWYYTFEFYINNGNYYSNWASMLNNTIAEINRIDSTKRLITSLFVSNYYNVDFNKTREDFTDFIDSVNFRTNDIINMQDGLGTSNYSVEKVNRYISTVAAACNESIRNVKFWINVENYENRANLFTAASLERYILQLKIASNYADELASFSYSHYYTNIAYDREYRNHYTDVTNNTLTKIDTPSRGSVYEDQNGDEVVVPFGFTVDSENNIVSDGLVIKDSYGNEFVWIPVKGGVKSKCYVYGNNEYTSVYYTRYLNNGANCADTVNDTLPSGVSSDETQINKYSGFYVGRYEASYSYNNNSPRPIIKVSTNTTEGFSYQYADNVSYDGFLWNNINYSNAKSFAESMAARYGYDSSIKTGLINGTQWDTILKWIHANDNTYSMIYDSRSWGNYNDSISPATNGNYTVGMLKNTGSNINWKVMNIYDLAGNLGEWTSERTNNRYSIRGNSYNTTGAYGASITLPADSYQYSHVGFRIVLYVE